MPNCATFRTPTRRGRLDPVDSPRSGLQRILTMAVLPDFDMLLFGGTGDLVTRKLLPALYRRCAAGQVSANSRIFGMARSAWTRSAYTAQAEAACREFIGNEFDAKLWEDFSRRL